MKKTAIIVGANHGHTGFAIAARFAKEGYDIALTCRKQADVEETKKQLSKISNTQILTFCVDLRNRESIHAMFKALDEHGAKIKTLCLNAADLALGSDPSKGTPFFEVTPEYVSYILEANVVGNFCLAQKAARRMKEDGGGAIVFVGSNTSVRPNQNRVPYVASKGGIQSMSKGLAVDLGKYGIRSNVVMPGTIKTARWVSMGDRQITNGSMIPIGDISDFEDVANAVYFLGSEESKNITGTELVVDGGMTTQLYPEILNRYRAEDIAKRTKGE